MSIIDELIFDRTDEDLEVAKNYIKNNQPLPSDNLRYSWDCRALNRTEEAMEYVNEIFKELGYFRNMEFKTDWFADEITPKQSKRYISNLKTLRSYLTMPSDTPVVPNTINGMTIERANEIEKIIHDIDVVLEALQNNFVYSGVCGSGQNRIWQQRFRRKPYTRLEYITCTGTQHIDMGIAGNDKTKIVLKIKPTYTETSSRQLLGTLWDVSKAITFNLSKTNGTYRWGNAQTSTNRNPLDIFADTEYVIEISENGYYVNGVKKWSPTPSTFTTKGNMYLFSAMQTSGKVGSVRFRGKFYYCQVYDNETLVRDFIPVLNNAGVPCLLDKVQNRFYYSQGTGGFIADD